MRGSSAAGPSGRFADVLAAARAGDGVAMRSLYESLWGPIVGYLRARGVADAEAAANETFYRAFSRLRIFRGDEAGFRSWLFTIAHNLSIDEHRKASRRPAASGDEPGDEPTGNAEDDAMAAIEHEAVSKLLGTLTPQQRDVLYLRVVAGLGVADTARVLRTTPGAVKSLQHRGLAALREMLAGRVSETSTATFPEA